MSKKIQVKVSGWFSIYVDDKLTKDMIEEIVNECEYISDFLDMEGVDDIGESDDCDYEICNDNNDSNKYIWYDDELNNGTNNNYFDYDKINKKMDEGTIYYFGTIQYFV